MNNKILLENLQNEFNKFNSYNLRFPKENNKKDYNFDVLSNLLVNKDFNKTTFNILDNMYKYYGNNKHSSLQVLSEKINTRVFLTSYMVNFNFDEIINEKNQITLNLEEKASLLLKNYSKLSNYLTNYDLNNLDNAVLDKFIEDTLINAYKFKLNFDFYIKKDKKDLIQILLQSHFELKQTLEVLNNKQNENKLSEENKEWLEHIPHQIEKVEDKIAKLEPQHYQELIDNFQPITASKETQQDMLKVAQKAYFDVLREEVLKTNPPNYKKFIVLFCELKDIMKSFIPNRKDLHESLDENINNELLNELLDNSRENLIELRHLCFYIIDNIHKLESQLEDEDTKMWINSLEENFENLRNFETNNYYTALLEIYIVFFQKSHQKLDKIRSSLVRLSEKDTL